MSDKKIPDMNTPHPLDEKAADLIRQAMDKRKFGHADAVRHIIDRDKGDKINAQPVKPKDTLLQTERVEFAKNGQWCLVKDNSVKPYGQNIYNSTANIERKMGRTGEVREGAGKNQAVQSYTTSGSSVQQAHEKTQQKLQDAKTKMSTRTAKDMSPEQLKEIEQQALNNKKKPIDR